MPSPQLCPTPDTMPESAMDKSLQRLLRLWSLRVVVQLGGHRELLAARGFMSESVAGLIDLGDTADLETLSVDPPAALAQLRQQHIQAEQLATNAALPLRLQGNVQRLSEALSLDAVASRLLAFTALLHSEGALDEVCGLLGSLSSNDAIRALAVILDLPVKAVRETLGANSALTRSGLLRLDRSGDAKLSHKLDMLSAGFADSLCSSDAEPLHLLRDVICPSPEGTLLRDDYPHVKADLDILEPYLRLALQSALSGVNILLYGPPGTGKTELARLLARLMEAPLYEIASADKEGDPLRGDRRLRALRTGQQVLSQQTALLVFDEVEDVFGGNERLFGHPGFSGQLKGWLNRTLEENPVPTLWISNDVRDMDAAFLRRFAMVIELPIPPRYQRQRMIERHGTGTLSPETAARLAQHERLSPAVIAQACRVVCELPDTTRGEKQIVQLINNALRVQGHRPVPVAAPGGLSDLYDLAHLNVDSDLTRLAGGLERHRTGRLCLFGPPGIGKTHFVHWLADHLDLPLIACSASDLLSPWLGETEQQIARLFTEAEREPAILLLDEIDSFLHQRRMASKSWEVSQVNELLVRLEQHSGIVVACTNRLEGLDRAAMRRFDRKIRFSPLRAEQTWELLHRYCEALRLEPPREQDWVDLAALHSLTPGDFHTIVRRHHLEPLESTAAFIRALREEHSLKDDTEPHSLGIAH